MRTSSIARIAIGVLLLFCLWSTQTGCRSLLEKLGLKRKGSQYSDPIGLPPAPRKSPSAAPIDGGGGQGGEVQEGLGDPQIRDYFDEDGYQYRINDDVVIISFSNPPEFPENPPGPVDPLGNENWLNEPEIGNFISQESLTVLNHWPALKALYAGLPPEVSVEEAIERYPTQYPDLIEDVSPDFLVSPHDLLPSNDYFYEPESEPQHKHIYGQGQWYIQSDTFPEGLYGTKVSRAWGAGNTGSSSTVIAVIDSGVDRSHPDLLYKIHPSGIDIRRKQVDRFPNGIYGIFGTGKGVPKWDAFTSRPMAAAHGTCVAGIIAAQSNDPYPDGLGVAGIDWLGRIFPISLEPEWDLEKQDYLYSSAMLLEALYDLGTIKGRFNYEPDRIPGYTPSLSFNPRVVNLSKGVTISRKSFDGSTRKRDKVWGIRGKVHDGIRNLWFSGTNYPGYAVGTAFVASGGNNNRRLAPDTGDRVSPANLPEVISVAAINKQGYRAVWNATPGTSEILGDSASNWGSLIDLSAGGVGIFTTDVHSPIEFSYGHFYGDGLYLFKYGSGVFEYDYPPGHPGGFWNNPTNYFHFFGTSAAAPVVSGVVALYIAAYPLATPEGIEPRLKATARNLPADPILGIVVPPLADAYEAIR